MSNFMDNLEQKFSSISIREQNLVFYAVPFLICLVAILGFIEPAISKDIKTRNDISNLKLQLLTVQNNLDLMQVELSVDPNIETKSRISGIIEKIGRLEKQFDEEFEQLVPPQAMPLVLEELFAKSKRLKLIKMSSIAPRNLFDADEKALSEKNNSLLVGVPALYQHGMRITFEGSFFDTRDFLLSAEQLGWKLHWQEVVFEVTDYPVAKVDIEFFTLSMSEVYINVKQ